MKTAVMNPVKAFTLLALGLAAAAIRIYVANADNAPGAAALFPQSQEVPSVRRSRFGIHAGTLRQTYRFNIAGQLTTTVMGGDGAPAGG